MLKSKFTKEEIIKISNDIAYIHAHLLAGVVFKAKDMVKMNLLSNENLTKTFSEWIEEFYKQVAQMTQMGFTFETMNDWKTYLDPILETIKTTQEKAEKEISNASTNNFPKS